MIDPKFTEEIARWLDSEHTSKKQIEAGAMLLLKLNRDQGMFQRIMRRPDREVKFLEYKLRRFLRLRQDGQTIRDVISLDKEITPEIAAAVMSNSEESDVDKLPVVDPAIHDGDTGCVVHKGMRPDHDKLPENIKAIWPANAERWKKIKEAFEACKSLTEPCDRYEYLKVLKETWYKYKEEMARYDDFKLTDEGGAEGTVTGDEGTDQTPALTPEQEKQVANARSYISKNLQELLTIHSRIEGGVATEQDTKDFQKKQPKVKERVDLLLSLKQPLGDDLKGLLKEVGIDTEEPETPAENEQGQESE
jgi:hypothetical protein